MQLTLEHSRWWFSLMWCGDGAAHCDVGLLETFVIENSLILSLWEAGQKLSCQVDSVVLRQSHVHVVVD